MARISLTGNRLSEKNLSKIQSKDVSSSIEIPALEQRSNKRTRIGFTNMNTDQKEKPFKPHLNKKKEIALKDSILFKTDTEYEEYLYTILESYGLFAELYDHFKVFLMSKSDVVGLEKLWKYSGDLKMDPCDLLLEKADVLRQISRIDLAYDYLEQASRQYPENAMVNYGMAMYHKLKREYELALHWMNKWMVVDGSNSEVYYQLGSTYHRMGSYDLAVQKLRECLILDSKHLGAQSLLDKIT